MRNRFTIKRKATCLLLIPGLALFTEPCSSLSTNIDAPTVNILTWWGYLDSPKLITSIENKCRIKISVDEYYSNEEFTRRLRSNPASYDIAIFSEKIYAAVKTTIPNFPNNRLWDGSKNYNKIIKTHYNKLKYPHNVVYFSHSLNGFLWNPNVITLSEKDSIFSIFQKAKNLKIALIDDPLEEQELIYSALNEQRTINKLSYKLTLENFHKVIQHAEVYITNNYSRIYEDINFAFAFTWSGEAISNLHSSNKKYNFFVHPNLSYISTDLLAVLSSNKNTSCVADILTSKETSNQLQNKNFYFSPYADDSKVSDPELKKAYKIFKNFLPHHQWNGIDNGNEFEEINYLWQKIKFSIINIK